MSSKTTFVIIDGNALIHRAWHAIPPLSTRDGVMINAAYGFTSIFLKVLKDLKPNFIAVTFDTKAPTFRHEEFKEYKAQREKQPDELYAQIPIVKEIVNAFDFPVFEKNGFEADDLIATLERRIHETDPNIEVLIVTGDMDTLQLVNEHTKIYTLKKSINDTIIYDIASVKERFGLTPEQMVDYKALRGDPSDNIPGVKGIGEKTARELLGRFKTIENLYQHLQDITGRSGERIRQLLEDSREVIPLNKKLVALISDVPMKLDFKKSRVGVFNYDKIYHVFSQYEFKSLLNRLADFIKTPKKAQQALFSSQEGEEIQRTESYHLVSSKKEFEQFFQKLQKQKEFVFDTETDSLNPRRAKLLGMSFSWKENEAYYVQCNHALGKKFLEKLQPVFLDSEIKKDGHNLKFDMAVIKTSGIEVRGEYFDSMIASYLLNPGSRGHSLDNLAFVEFGHQMISIEELIGKGKTQITLEKVPLETLCEYSCEDADYTWRLVEKLKPRLCGAELENLFYCVEMPLVRVLMRMERNGVKINAVLFKKLSKELGKKIQNLEKSIERLIGVSININSPQQIKEVLFKKLRISSFDIRKTKTGLSTAASELEKLKHLHPVIPLILEHRELSKLKNTYLDAIPELIDPETGRVHTSYNQTVTSTGRLSSSDPNLQNIPIRTELGEEIRSGFIAEKGCTLVSADYSQIELRIIASLSSDKRMIEIFQKGEDIHRATAAAINKVSISEVTKEMRYSAKAINFGIIYGMGAYGLSKSAGISVQEAQNFIDEYFLFFSGVKKYIEEVLEKARRDGFTKTYFGRIRHIPEIHSGVSQVRNAAERMAINMPIQGTAADLIKLAMIRIDKRLAEEYSLEQCKMILQVHDELVFEAREDCVEKISKMVKEEMENVVKLEVPIVADVEVGESWGGN